MNDQIAGIVIPDPELLYVGAMFHDLGLTDTYRTLRGSTWLIGGFAGPGGS
ncbi:hypothetical protein [Nocardia sp. NPDC057440]|uniref:hypothetical protein n=1 Tax=Nocardia sp. NPDC057440 TaxID=3346134 RepID=UPI00366D35C9